MTSQVLTKLQVSDAGEDTMHQFLAEIRQYPRLTVEQEKELAKRCAQGDAEAIRQMVNSNLRLVVSVAREYAGRGVPLLDLVQEGSIGLIAAAKKFDHTLDFRFSTYATKWIRQGVTQCLADYGLIRVPHHTAQQIRQLLTAKTRLAQENGAEPTEQELAAYCNVSVQRLRRLLQLKPDVCSLDTPVGEEDTALWTLLEDIDAVQPQEKLVREELSQTLNKLLSLLTQRQQLTLRLHFGLEDGICHSLEEISHQLGVSKERVRQIVQQAMQRLQQNGASMGLEDFLE